MTNPTLSREKILELGKKADEEAGIFKGSRDSIFATLIAADFARQLKRELSNAKEQIAEWREHARVNPVLLGKAEAQVAELQALLAKERERCARVCDEFANDGGPSGPYECAIAIRAMTTCQYPHY